MKLLFTQESDFRRERDFGAKVGATFDFISAQLKPFVKCLAYFVLPGALLIGIGLGLFMGKASGFYATLFQGARRGANNVGTIHLDPLAMYRGWGGVGLALAMLGGLITIILLSSTVYSYLRVRLNLPAAETVQPRQVWGWMAPRLGRMVRACLLLMGLWVGAMVVLGTIFTGMAAVGGGGYAVLFIFVLYAAIIWLAGCLALYFPVMWLEDVGPMEALRRSFYLIRGKWWSTFGLAFVMVIIQSIVSYIFAIPMYGLMAMDLLQLTKTGTTPDSSSLLMQAATLLYSGSAVLLLALPLLALGFQYFNLAERRDNIGARQQLALLGQTAAPEAASSYYRPDEEGEY